jgi:hypothetical protein
MDLASITWQLDAYAGHWLANDELTAIADWMADNHLTRATAERPVIVKNGTITYGQDRSPSTVRAPHRDIVTITVLLRTAPPKVWQPDCGPAAMAQLHEAFRRHEWSSGFGGVCVDCSQTRITGMTSCRGPARPSKKPWPRPEYRFNHPPTATSRHASSATASAPLTTQRRSDTAPTSLARNQPHEMTQLARSSARWPVRWRMP